MTTKKTAKTPYGVVHHFPGGTKKQYQASVAAVHPAKGRQLPPGQIYHAAGPSEDGWTIIAIHESKASWEAFRDKTLLPVFKKGIKGGFPTPPQETAFKIAAMKC